MDNDKPTTWNDLNTCPVCGKKLPDDASETLKPYPFCSSRCRLVDFYRWTEGHYQIVEDVDPYELLLNEESGLSPYSEGEQFNPYNHHFDENLDSE